MKIDNEAKVHRVPRQIARDVRRAIENNGEVTLPGFRRHDSLLTRRHIQFFLLAIAMVLARRRSG